MAETNAVAVRGDIFSLTPKSLGEAMEFSKLIASSQLCPKQFQGKHADILIAVQMGAELGVSPMQALQNIAVINGRVVLWGDLIVALVQRTGELEYLKEEWNEASMTATARIKRKGQPEHLETFSMADAKRAGYDSKDTYRQHPKRMCGWRAKTWAIRAQFADALKGLSVAEEAVDMIDITDRATVAMPRRASESPAPNVDQFIGSGATAEPPRQVSAPAPAQPPATAKQSANGHVEWNGTLTAKAAPKSGKKADGVEWTKYGFKGSDGSWFSTFSSTVADIAGGFVGTGEEVLIEYEAAEKGNNIIGISAMDQPPQDGE